MKTKILNFCAFFLMFFSIAQNINPTVAKTYEKNNNIFVAFSNGTEKQLTFQNIDFNPNLSQNREFVVFIRNLGNNLEINKVFVKNLEENLITSSKPYKDEIYMDNKIHDIDFLTIIDNENIFFVTDNNNEYKRLVKVNINNGNWILGGDADIAVPILDSNQKLNLIIIGEDKKGNFFQLVDENLKLIRKFKDNEEALKYAKELLDKM